ncbi:MAG: SPOR domain-containing protein [Proteobacteria bacterium]|nr:SPOR domain-containing protein [Pseudomonadota bacterium]
MSQQLKERLTGAAVLVILGALLIPEFLSGPPPDNPSGSDDLLLPAADAQPVRTHTIRLNDPQAADQPPVAQRVRSEPQTARHDAGLATANSPGGPQAVKPGAGNAAAAGQKTPARLDGWAVQAGSFSSLENARRLAATLQSMGYDSFISETVIDGRNLHRVRIGPLADRKAADRIAKELQQQGQQAKSVPHP